MVRQTKYDHNAIVALPNDGTKAVSRDAWNDGHNEFGMAGHGTVTTLTIASGNITPVNDMHIIDGEGAANDTLSNIINTETAEFDEIWLYAGAQQITVQNNAGGTGQITTQSGDDIFLSTTVPLKIIRKGTDWFETGSGAGTTITSIFGSGVDGDATNPVLSGGDIKNYNNLTINSPVTWTGTGTIVIRVAGTFDLTSTLTINTLGTAGTLGGSGAGSGGNGGNGGTNRATIIIIANTTTGTGTIESTGIDGTDGAVGVDTGGSGDGVDAEDGVNTEAFGIEFKRPTGGGGGINASSPIPTPGSSGTAYTETNIAKVIDFILAHYRNFGGTGGGEGHEHQGGGNSRAASGGAGGNIGVARGGNGGLSSLAAASTNTGGGGGGGGGSAALLILITKTVTAITVNLTGGDGGNGELNSNGVARAGGGGGAPASWVLIAAIDNAIGTLTGGSVGSGGFPGVGETRKVFGTFEDFTTITERLI